IFLAPALAGIPSIRAVSVSGIYLSVVGVCLACWSAYMRRRYVEMIGWLVAVCSLPIITILTLGFVGYGATAALMVFTFVCSFYKPRWQAALALCLSVFLGLCLFVTYFRDRPLIRAKVWGGASYSDRIESLIQTFTNFEIIDFQNPQHLDAID